MAASPRSSSTHIRWLKPSFDPIVLVISSSGSSCTPHVALVQRGDRLAELRQAAADRVAMVARDVGRLGELVDGDLRRRDVGVAEPEVDHI